jgi:hypothetical protein
VPATHCTHTLEAFRPVSALAVPAAQLVHCPAAEAPAVVPYVPAGHGVQVAIEVAGLAVE